MWAGRRAAARLRRRGRGRLPGYRDGLEAAGLADEELFAWRALDALRPSPAAWGDTPLFVYGFDDFDRIQLDALETIAAHADVTVSLPFEPGRRAFKAVPTLHQELLARGAEEHQLAPVDDHYAPESRAALHHVERLLFEDEPAARVDPGRRDLVPFRRRASGPRSSSRPRGSLQLLRAGVEPGDVAVVFREPGALLVAARAGLRRLRNPLLDRPQAPASATPGSAAACWR